MKLVEITRRGFVGSALATGFTSLARPKSIDLNPFNRETQEFVFKWVADQRRTEINEVIPRPVVHNFNAIDKSVFKETWGSIPGSPVNTYHYKRNWIILSPNAKADSLAHEYEHYFQFFYDAKGNIDRTGWDWDGISPDTPEIEAKRIQQLFRDKYF